MNQKKNDNFDEMMVKKEIALNKIVENGMVELNEKMKRGMNELKDEIKKGLADLKATKKSKLEEENRELKKKIEKMAVYMKELKSSIRRRALPNELINHLFSSLPFENAFDLLAKMPNGLLAKIVEKMINGMKEGLKKNKWNKDDCGSKLVISQGGLAVRHKGPKGWHCVRAILPIPSFSLKDIDKTIISSYFEMQIIRKSSRYASIEIGFFDKQFNLESEYQGRGEANSISLFHKEELSIEGAIKLTKLKKGNGCIYFEKGDFIGIGIIHKANSLMECFATWNGNFLGKQKLPAIYANIQLFPAISMSNRGDSMGADSDDAIRVNFGKIPWRFKDFRYIH